MDFTTLSMEIKAVIGFAFVAMFFAFVLGGLTALAVTGFCASCMGFLVAGVAWLTKYGPE